MNTLTQDSAARAASSDDKTELIALVRAAQRGERDAFGQLFERFERHVMAIALRRLGDYGEAQELCQDVFIQAMKKIRQLREPEAFAGWLRSITNRMAINRLIRRPNDYAIENETLVAFYVHGRSLNEMSSEFEAPVGTIKRRLHVARKRLAKEVEELAV